MCEYCKNDKELLNKRLPLLKIVTKASKKIMTIEADINDWKVEK